MIVGKCIKIIIISLLSLHIVNCQEKTLTCYITNKQFIAELPIIYYESYEWETITLPPSEIQKYGDPICLTYFARNKTHSLLWQGITSSFTLPAVCNIDHETHCFKTPDPLEFVDIKRGYACCCKTPKCNSRNPKIMQLFEKITGARNSVLSSFSSVLYYFFYFAILFVSVILMTFFNVFIPIFFEFVLKLKNIIIKQQPEKNYEYNRLPSDKKTSLSADNIKRTMSPSKSKSAQLATYHSPTQREAKKTSKSSIRDEKKQKNGAASSASLISVARTQDEDENSIPLPPKPKPRVLKTGRVQRVSMNFDESTFSDLEK